MARKSKELTDILTEMNALRPADVNRATAEVARSHKPLHEVIVEMKLASEEDVTKGLAIQYDMEYIDLDKSVLAASNFDLIPADLVKKHLVLPMDKKNGVLRIVIGDPTDIDTIDALKFRLNTKIETCLGVRSKIKHHIDRMCAEENVSIDQKVRNQSFIDRGVSLDMKVGGSVTGDD